MVVKALDDRYMVVRGILAARGAKDAPVVFTSVHDDDWGGDTDGMDFLPQTGDWGWVEFAETSNDAACVAENTVFRYGGNAGTDRGAIRVRSASPTIRFNEFSGNVRCIYLEGDAAPKIEKNCFLKDANQTTGVWNTSPTTLCATATNNYWGDVSGPSDASNRTDACDLGTHAGAGVLVSDGVRYNPWLTEPDCAPSTAVSREFRRGDTDTTGTVNLTDAVRILNALFLGIGTIPCDDAADSTDDGVLNLTDAVRILNVLFLGMGDICLPGMDTCGPDPTDDPLECENYDSCQVP